MKINVQRLSPKSTAGTDKPSAKPVAVKRVYEKPTRSDGNRVLVDRLWPRGLSKERAALHQWLRALAPSDALRHWYHARPEGAASWLMFRKRYLKELSKPESAPALDELYRLANRRTKLTLLFASKNETHNNAVVLKDLLEGMRKPPTGTGPGGIRAIRFQEKRMPR
jgi:uncharacterized protein YeaO (DUF488 family)